MSRDTDLLYTHAVLIQVGALTHAIPSYQPFVFLGGIVVIVLAIGHKIHGFKPGRGQWIF
jgi:hypothetical protein